MNEAILVTDLEEGNWFALGYTKSNSANWGFDRFRIYTSKWYTRVGVFSYTDYVNNGVVDPNGQIRIINKVPTYGSKVFASNGSFEHDFFFDLSANVNNDQLAIAICGLPTDYEVQQIYATPRGYSASTGRSAELTSWLFSTVNCTLLGGGVTSSLVFRNNTAFTELLWNDNTRTPKLFAKSMEFQNCGLVTFELDKLITWTDAGGQINGTLNYSGNPNNPSANSKTAYDNLINKGWTITGTPPPLV